MASTVKIRNISTGQLTDIPYELWKDKKNTPEFRGVFERIKVRVPPEVVALIARQAATNSKKLS
jgi:hypothetical protein